MKEIVILGGPNGAGKTTAARVLLPGFFEEHEFLNADEIARRMASPRVLIAEKRGGQALRVCDHGRWNRIEGASL